MTRSSRNKRTAPLALSLLLAATAFLGTAPGAAQAAFPEAGKTITWIVPTSPGGGFDTFSRMFIPYLQKQLPNNPNIVVKNIKGGEWNIGLSALNRSDPDGYTIGITNMPGNAVNQVLGKAQYDLGKFTWIGNISDVTYVACVSKNSKYQTLEAMQKAPEVTAGVVGLASMAGLGTILAADAMHYKVKAIPHDGSTEAILSAMRGDVDLVQYPMATLKKTIVDSNDLTPVWVFAKKRLKLLPNVPTVGEIGYPELADVVYMIRPVAGPPGLPADVAKTLRDAFAKAWSDPEFQAQLQKKGVDTEPMSAEELTEVVARQIKQVEGYKGLIQQAMK
ncbi:MAG: tripartite tricarboxylate transporter substrate binding protein [Deferrisomatales bacterium]|nr:tripartite tricarboxylate transporter substrate binding protein [Deferrisomatales bacterium]